MTIFKPYLKAANVISKVKTLHKKFSNKVSLHSLLTATGNPNQIFLVTNSCLLKLERIQVPISVCDKLNCPKFERLFTNIQKPLLKTVVGRNR